MNLHITSLSLEARITYIYILLACEKRGNNSTERLFCKYIDEFRETGVKGIDKWWGNVVYWGLKWEIRTNLMIKFDIFKHRDVVEIGVKNFRGLK